MRSQIFRPVFGWVRWVFIESNLHQTAVVDPSIHPYLLPTQLPLCFLSYLLWPVEGTITESSEAAGTTKKGLKINPNKVIKYIKNEKIIHVSVSFSYQCGTAGWGTAGRGGLGEGAWGFPGSLHQNNAWEDGLGESWRGRERKGD